jgi:hypothetical protein
METHNPRQRLVHNILCTGDSVGLVCSVFGALNTGSREAARQVGGDDALADQRPKRIRAEGRRGLDEHLVRAHLRALRAVHVRQHLATGGDAEHAIDPEACTLPPRFSVKNKQGRATMAPPSGVTAR